MNQNNMYIEVLLDVIGSPADKNIIENLAKHLSLNVWDWIAVLVALCSLIVAMCSFIIAKRTLRSQRQTEKNTMPIMNMEIQKFLLNEFFVKLFDGHLKITALWYLLNDKNYELSLSEHIIENIKLPLSYIHCELFYKNTSSYRLIEGLYDSSNEYNTLLESLTKQIQNTSKNKFLIYTLFEDIIHKNDRIASLWITIMPKLFDIASKELSLVLDVFIENIAINDIKTQKQNNYSESDIYVKIFNSAQDKQKILYFMHNKNNEYYNYFLKYTSIK